MIIVVFVLVTAAAAALLCTAIPGEYATSVGRFLVSRGLIMYMLGVRGYP